MERQASGTLVDVAREHSSFSGLRVDGNYDRFGPSSDGETPTGRGQNEPTETVSGTRPIRILVVSDTRLYRDGLREVFGRTDTLSVIGAAAHAEDALEVLGTEPVDVVLLGLAGPDAIAAAQFITAAHAGVRIVALAVDDRPEDVVPLAEVGVCGYVARDASLSDLVHTLRSVVRGESPCSPGVAAGLLRRLATLTGGTSAPTAPGRLTAREQQVLSLMGEGLSNKQIARRLCIELPTVKNHVHHVLEKLQVHRRTEAVAVIRRGSWD
jgi:DNA-binding NarL/FixJ family response regulator